MSDNSIKSLTLFFSKKCLTHYSHCATIYLSRENKQSPAKGQKGKGEEMKKNNSKSNGDRKRVGGINGYVLGHMLSASIAHHGIAMLQDCNEKQFLRMLDYPQYYRIQWVSKKKLVITLESDSERNYIIRETNRGAIFTFPGFEKGEVEVRKFFRK